MIPSHQVALGGNLVIVTVGMTGPDVVKRLDKFPEEIFYRLNGQKPLFSLHFQAPGDNYEVYRPGQVLTQGTYAKKLHTYIVR